MAKTTPVLLPVAVGSMFCLVQSALEKHPRKDEIKTLEQALDAWQECNPPNWIELLCLIGNCDPIFVMDSIQKAIKIWLIVNAPSSTQVIRDQINVMIELTDLIEDIVDRDFEKKTPIPPQYFIKIKYNKRIQETLLKFKQKHNFSEEQITELYHTVLTTFLKSRNAEVKK